MFDTHWNFETIQSVCSPRHGDCGSFARALQKIHGGELVGFYTSENDELPKHVVLKYNNTYVDFDSVATESQIAQEYFITGENMVVLPESEKEIHDVMINQRIVKQLVQILKNNT